MALAQPCMWEPLADRIGRPSAPRAAGGQLDKTAWNRTNRTVYCRSGCAARIGARGRTSTYGREQIVHERVLLVCRLRPATK